jgi:hypothetical protein
LKEKVPRLKHSTKSRAAGHKEYIEELHVETKAITVQLKVEPKQTPSR